MSLKKALGYVKLLKAVIEKVFLKSANWRDFICIAVLFVLSVFYCNWAHGKCLSQKQIDVNAIESAYKISFWQ